MSEVDILMIIVDVDDLVINEGSATVGLHVSAGHAGQSSGCGTRSRMRSASSTATTSPRAACLRFSCSLRSAPRHRCNQQKCFDSVKLGTTRGDSTVTAIETIE